MSEPFGREGVARHAVDADLPAFGTVESSQRPEQSGLAATVRPYQPQDPASDQIQTGAFDYYTIAVGETEIRGG